MTSNNSFFPITDCHSTKCQVMTSSFVFTLACPELRHSMLNFKSIQHYIEGGRVRHHGALREDWKKLNVHKWKGAALLNTSGQRTQQPKDELFLTLVRLRLAAPLADLAQRFVIHTSTASRTFNTYLDLLYRHFATLSSSFWPSCAVVDSNISDNSSAITRAHGVIDCTEIKIEQPSDSDLQRVTRSSY